MKTFIRAISGTVTLAIAACGGGSSNSSTPPVAAAPAPLNQSVGGVWSTQYSVPSGANMGDVVTGQAIVDEAGDFYLFGLNQTNGCAEIAFGSLVSNGSTVSGTAQWAIVNYSTIPGVTPNCVEVDGSTYGTATVSGNVTARSSLMLADVDTTAAGTVLPSSSTSWNYNTLYSQPSSLATLAGNYTDNGSTLSITASGAITEQDGSGCILNGQVTVPNSAYNAYSFSADFANCTGANAGLNGVTVTGLGTLDTTQTPNVLYVGLRATVNGGLTVLALKMPKQ